MTARRISSLVALRLALIFTCAWSPIHVRGCTNDDDCMLNGICAEKRCVCDAAWTGDDCGFLNLLPVSQNVSFHGKTASTTSWGGSVLPVSISKLKDTTYKYVMYAAEMMEDCGLNTWKTNSEVVVATSTEPSGPYVEIDQVAPPWAHNPEAIYIPAGEEEEDQQFGVVAIFALGDGVPIHGNPTNCSASATATAAAAAAANAKRRREISAVRNQKKRRSDNATGNTTVSFTIHYSTAGFLGPWMKYDAQIIDFPLSYHFPGNWNPAPLLMKDGKVRIVVHTDVPEGWSGEVIVEADTWTGPYKPITRDITNCTKCAEDPYLWRDGRGHYHMLYHKMFDGPHGHTVSPIPSPGWCGGHSFSRDGISWSPIRRAYNTTVHYVDGTQRELKRRERPKLIFDTDGTTPLYLSNGVQDQNMETYTLVTPINH